ncbi:MAG: O-antigen ligase family protein [Burkholderiales bacterium]
MYQWAGIALLAAAWTPWRLPALNALGLLTVLYGGWLLVNALAVSPVYAAEGVYQPLMLLGAFAVFASIGRERAEELFGAGVALASALVLLGLLQHFFSIWSLDGLVWRLPENPLRAAATFVTPNSFATAINMFLLPLSALYVLRGSGRSFALVLWLFAGLAASQSRGGLLAWMAGLAYLALCLGLKTLRREQRRVLHLLAGCIAVWIAVAAAGMLQLPGWGFEEGGAARAAVAEVWVGRGMAERPELYAATLDFILERPLLGYGANMFFPLFETVKSAELRDSIYFYTHNDYLQAWLEFGALGLVLLVALGASALWIALRAFRRAPADPLPLVCGAALAPCFAHAVVDFPFYIPFILMLIGAYLGTLARVSGEPGIEPASLSFNVAARTLSPPIRWTLALAALLWLAQPMIAEFAVLRSIVLLRQGEARDALYWQSVARRLEPRHPAHYWAEATIWRQQAIMTRNPQLAEQADALFAEGTRVHPYEVANLLGRAELHRKHGELLKDRAPPAEVLSWSENAARLRPQSLAVQAELVRSLAFAGEKQRAQVLARALAEKYPESNFARRLAVEL